MRRQPPASPSPPGKRLGPLQRLDFRIPAADRLGLGLDLANKLTSVSAEAKAAGLRLGDRVVLLDGVDVSGGRDRVTQFAARRARDATSVLVGVERRGKPSRDWATVPPALLLCLFFSSVGALLFTVSMLERLHLAVGDEGGVASFAREGTRRAAWHHSWENRETWAPSAAPPPPPPPPNPAAAAAAANASAAVAAATAAALAAELCATAEFRAPPPPLTVVVMGWRRVQSLRRLLASLEAAVYCGHAIELRVLLDGGAAPTVRALADGAVARWAARGGGGAAAVVDLGPASLGTRGVWIQGTATIATHIVPLEDDVELSPLWYWWLLRAAAAYGPLHALPKSAAPLAGISLYTPRLNEIAYPQKSWRPDGFEREKAFLLQVPCSWGSLFLAPVWRDFLAFYATRAAPPFYDPSAEARQRGAGAAREPLGDGALLLPASRSNTWARSWKRFMVDFMYGRGLVMLYPNLPRQAAFATTYMERGEHSAIDGIAEAVAPDALRADLDVHKTTPLVGGAPVERSDARVADARAACAALATLPTAAALPVYDLHHRRASLGAVGRTARRFTARVARRGGAYTALAAAWSGECGGFNGCRNASAVAPGSSIDDDEEVEAADVEVEVDHGTAGGDEAAEDTYLLEYHDLPIAAVVAAVVGACACALHRRWRRRRAKLSTFSV